MARVGHRVECWRAIVLIVAVSALQVAAQQPRQAPNCRVTDFRDKCGTDAVYSHTICTTGTDGVANPCVLDEIVYDHLRACSPAVLGHTSCADAPCYQRRYQRHCNGAKCVLDDGYPTGEVALVGTKASGPVCDGAATKKAP